MKTQNHDDIDLELFSTIVEMFQQDPVWATQNALGNVFWSKQKEIFDTVWYGDLMMTAVASGNGLGKTFIAARMAYAWLCAHPSGIVRVVAPGEKSMKELFFKEFRVVLREDSQNAKWLSTMGTPGALRHEMGEDWNLLGVNSNNTENMAGHHADDMLVIVDEASGVEQYAFDAIDSWMTGPNNRLLLIANPTKTHGVLYEAFHNQSHLWNNIFISALHSPNMTEEALRDYPEVRQLMKERGIEPSTEQVPEYLTRTLPTPEKVQAKYDKARSSGAEAMDTFRWQVLAEWPQQDEYAILSTQRINEAMEASIPDDQEYVLYDSLRFGIDVSRSGRDRAIIMMGEGPRITQVGEYTKTRTTDLAQIVFDTIDQKYMDVKARRAELGNTHFTENDVIITLDHVGVGAGCFDALDDLITLYNKGWVLVGFEVSAPPVLPDNKRKYNNRRTEAWYTLRKIMTEYDLDLPMDQGLRRELLSPLSSRDAKNKLAVEPKEKTKKRLKGISPDKADAVIMVTAPVDTSAGYVSHD